MIYNGNVVIKKMYEKKNYLLPIKGRKAEVKGFRNPVRVTSNSKHLSVFFIKYLKSPFYQLR